MKYLQHYSMKLIILCTTLISTGLLNASFDGPLQTGVDGTNTMVTVWHTVDSVIGTYKVQSVVSNGPWTPLDIVNITNPLLVNAYDDNVLAVSGTSEGTRAAVAWRAFDLFTGNKIIQVATLDNLGTWSSPVTLSLNDGNEVPLSDYQVAISSNGSVIVVTWTAYLFLTAREQIRAEISTDGGASWSPSPQNLSNF